MFPLQSYRKIWEAVKDKYGALVEWWLLWKGQKKLEEKPTRVPLRPPPNLTWNKPRLRYENGAPNSLSYGVPLRTEIWTSINYNMAGSPFYCRHCFSINFGGYVWTQQSCVLRIKGLIERMDTHKQPHVSTSPNVVKEPDSLKWMRNEEVVQSACIIFENTERISMKCCNGRGGGIL